MFIRLSALCLLICSVPGFPQTITTAQSQELRAEALSLKNDLTIGNYELAFQKIVEMNLIATGSPNTVHDRVAKMDRDPLYSFHLAPGATTPLVAHTDKLIAAIDSGVTADIQLQIKRMTDALVNTNRAQLKVRTENAPKPGDTLADRAFTLWVSLNDALSKGQGSITEAASYATDLQAVLNQQLEKHEFIWGYTERLYKINDTFGRAALAKGDVTGALAYLKKETEIPDDKTELLCCFGPNMWLAQRLLDAGYTDDVLFFLRGIKPYWTKDTHNRLDGWIAEMEKGGKPTFAPNNGLAW